MINIDKPKFFINELEYQDSINNLVSGYFAVEYGGGGIQKAPIPIYNHPEKRFLQPYVSITGEPATNYTLYFYLQLNNGYWNDIFLDEEDENITDSKYGSYIAILGHTRNQPVHPMGLISQSASYPDYPQQVIEPSPVFNMQSNSESGEYGFTYLEGGWSMAKGIKQNMIDNTNVLLFKIHSDMPFGSLAIGNYTTLPFNPNSNYQFELLHDGITYKTAKGGASFSYSNFDGPPAWTGGGAAWELGYQNQDQSGVWQSVPPPVKRRTGRRAYSMSWEGFADTDIMPTNTLSTPYSDTDGPYVDTNPTILDGNTLYNQILVKTLANSFIFQQDSTSFDPQNFMIGRWASPNMAFSQLSHKIYGFSNSIIESW